jgi:hypothetical protein
LNCFQRKKREEFDKRAQAYLERTTPDWGGGDAAFLSDFINKAVKQATDLAITREIDVIRYLELMDQIISPECWDSSNHAWIKEYLREKRPSEERNSTCAAVPLKKAAPMAI